MGQANKRAKVEPVMADPSKQRKEVKLGGQVKVENVNVFGKNLESLNEKTPVRIILLFRNDLRLHDNYIIKWAMQYQDAAIDKQGFEIVPVFCFDPRIYNQKSSKTTYGTRKTGVVRSRFQLETIECFRRDLKAIGSNLIASNEEPEVFIPKLLSQDFFNIVVYQQEICYEEIQVEENISKSIMSMAKKNNKLLVSVNSVWGSTLYHIYDLPF